MPATVAQQRPRCHYSCWRSRIRQSLPQPVTYATISHSLTRRGAHRGTVLMYLVLHGRVGVEGCRAVQQLTAMFRHRHMPPCTCAVPVEGAYYAPQLTHKVHTRLRKQGQQ